MATEKFIQQTTLIASADLSGSQYCFVAGDPANAKQMILPAASARTFGVLTSKPASGQSGDVITLGISKLLLGGTVTPFAALSANAAGAAVAATGQGYTGAIALEGGASGTYISAFVCGGGVPNGPDETNTVISLAVDLASLANGTPFTFTPGFSGKLVSATYVPGKIATTAAKTASLQTQIAGVATTGGALVLTTAGAGTLGTNAAFSAITALNTFSAVQAIQIAASAVTPFIEGSGTLVLVLQ